jgi:hypothetical protein
MGVGGQRHAPAALLPGKTRYPLYSRLSGPKDRSGRVWKISFCYSHFNMLTRVWQQLEYRIDVCRVTRGAHFEHL